MSQPRIVCLGGGHGLAATLTAARSLTSDITAIVTVADNGGSSGRLREEFNFLPPGDLRMALAALCSSDEWGRDWADILQYRFTSSGEMNGHALGNLLLTALWDRDGDPVAGIARVGDLLKIVGRVLPMAIEPLDIEATFNTATGRSIVRGQIQVATAKGHIETLRLIPENPKATPEAISAISEAEWLTFGPGSWFSSVMPHFLLREQAAAIQKSRAKKIMIFNLPEPSSEKEFAGVSAEAHLELILSHMPELRVDYAIADPASVAGSSKLQSVVEGCGGQLIVAPVAQSPGSFHHSSEKLASTLSHIFS
jgi:uncharacterized cofD-like protein